MNLLLGLPFVAVVWGLFIPILVLDGARAYIGFFWKNPGWLAWVVLNVGISSYWLARRLSQALLLRTTGAKLKATHGPS